VAEDTQLYQIISIDGNTLVRRHAPVVYDGFVSTNGQINELIDEIPDTPERRRPVSTKK
jgi:hypothetical protein